MEAKDLRIGNWVYHESEEKNNPFTVEVDLQDLEFISRGDISYSPIPLTPEILEKAGFVWSIYHQATHKEGFPFDLHEINDLYGYTMYTFKRSTHITSCLKYLHQLQNLYFALTDEELKIEL